MSTSQSDPIKRRPLYIVLINIIMKLNLKVIFIYLFFGSNLTSLDLIRNNSKRSFEMLWWVMSHSLTALVTHIVSTLILQVSFITEAQTSYVAMLNILFYTIADMAKVRPSRPFLRPLSLKYLIPHSQFYKKI